MSKEQVCMTDDYTKEQLLEAYSIEHHAHKLTQEKLKAAERRLAELRLMIKELQNGVV